MRDFECLVVGDIEVGKTSICQQLCYGKFPHTYVSTVVATYCQVEISGQLNTTGFNIWDLAGNNTYVGSRAIYYARNHPDFLLIFLVCDVTNQTTIDSIPKWLKELKKVNCDYKLFLVLNKTDLLEDYSAITHVIVQIKRNYPDKFELIVPLNAKDKTAVTQLFTNAAVTKLIEQGDFSDGNASANQALVTGEPKSFSYRNCCSSFFPMLVSSFRCCFGRSNRPTR